MRPIQFFKFGLGLLLCVSFTAAGAQETAPSATWVHRLEFNIYLIEDDSHLLPIFRADRGKLHVEARYNYEEIDTFSGWVGYNFVGGDDLEYTVTPMAGGVLGSTNGIAAGLELTFDYRGFDLYSESEYMFDLEDKENDFYYTWTDFSYAPRDWLWFGISVQVTLMYQSDVEVECGLLVGGSYRRFDIAGYVFNLGSDDTYGILTLALNF